MKNDEHIYTKNYKLQNFEETNTLENSITRKFESFQTITNISKDETTNYDAYPSTNRPFEFTQSFDSDLLILGNLFQKES